MLENSNHNEQATHTADAVGTHTMCTDTQPFHGYLLMDPALKILACDNAAAGILDSPSGALTSRAGTLQCRDTRWHNDLAGIVRHLGFHSANARSSASPDGQLRIDVSPMGGAMVRANKPYALLYVTSTIPLGDALRVALQLGLTHAEAQVLASLCQGRRLAAIARQRRVVVDTVRTQLKSSLAKLGLHSQVEAVALVYQLLLAEKEAAAAA
jgi:DNA-binding CsgD family transcriptional regulator